MTATDLRGDVGEVGDVGDAGVVAQSCTPAPAGAHLLLERGDGYSLYCPACKCGHIFRTTGPEPLWTFDMNWGSPTFRPSIRISDGQSICHLVVSCGQLIFCADCTHEFASKTVPMVDWDTIIAGK